MGPDDYVNNLVSQPWEACHDRGEGWRVPTKEELVSINLDIHEPATRESRIDHTAFPNTPASTYWSVQSSSEKSPILLNSGTLPLSLRHLNIVIQTNYQFDVLKQDIEFALIIRLDTSRITTKRGKQRGRIFNMKSLARDTGW